MLAHSILALGAFAVSSVSAQSSAADNTCEASPYRGLGCLAFNTAAASDCTGRLPVVTSTTTSTTSVLSEITATPSAKTYVKSQETVSLTNVDTDTVTVTCSATSTVYAPAISTTCLTSTITTYTSPSSTPTGQRQKRQEASSACIASGLEALASFNNETLGNACSCLNIAPSTEISTVYVTSYIAATTTSFAGLAPTTTAEILGKLTITETVSPNAITIPVSSTKTLTETTTISLAAPSYTPIFGPEAGCSSLNAGKAEALDNKITEDCEADKACQDLCDQEPTCKFLYVQRLFADYGGSTPYYQCYMDSKEFDEKRDLLCGRDEGIYGVARGFDACDRGVAEAEE